MEEDDTDGRCRGRDGGISVRSAFQADCPDVSVCCTSLSLSWRLSRILAVDGDGRLTSHHQLL